MAEIAKLKAPKGKEGVVIDTTEFAGIGKWSKGVFYHVNPDIPRRIGFEMLFDTGVDSKGVWLKIKGTSREAMEKNVPNIARSYQPRRYGDLKLPPGNWFYTRHGAVNLPYLEQESAAARFLNPLGTKIKIKTMEIHKTEAEGHNLLGRLNAVLATGYNAGVDVKKIRTTKRIVAGLSGEEIVVRHDDGEDKSLTFMWRHGGKPDSGTEPLVLIEMNAEDGEVDAKLKVWDAVLDSARPLNR